MGLKHKEIIGDATLYLGDCKDILPDLEMVDAVVTDPPYGINIQKIWGKSDFGYKQFENKEWDKIRPNKTIIKQLIKKSENQIIWGGNYFTDYLPPTMRWLIWDKGQRNFTLADFEMAWTSQDKASRIFNYPRAKRMQDGKQHPTQKPLALMDWCLSFLPDSKIIFDPFMGSGTTGVSSINLGKKFIGIEKEKDYFEIACKRISEAERQGNLLYPRRENPKQLNMDL